MPTALVRPSADEAGTAAGDLPDRAARVTRGSEPRSGDFHTGVLGGTVVTDGEPTIVKLAGGGRTDDKPQVVLEPPTDPMRACAFLNLRVADVQAARPRWPSDRGRPIDRRAPPERRVAMGSIRNLGGVCRLTERLRGVSTPEVCPRPAG
jgi:hypothetical protein